MTLISFVRKETQTTSEQTCKVNKLKQLIFNESQCFVFPSGFRRRELNASPLYKVFETAHDISKTKRKPPEDCSCHSSSTTDSNLL